MKEKIIPTPIAIVQPEEPIYIAPPTPKNHNGDKLVTPYAVTSILDAPTTPVMPMTRYIPVWKESNPFFDSESQKYYFYNSEHDHVMPIQNSAPEKAPPPVPNTERGRDYIACILTKLFSCLCPITREKTEYSTPYSTKYDVSIIYALAENYKFPVGESILSEIY